jgi:hypothetical protein
MSYIINSEGGVSINNGTSSNNKGLRLPIVNNARELSTNSAVVGTIVFDDL